MQHPKYKIALVGYQISHGGLEKVMATLSVYFGNQNIEVHNILLGNQVSYPFSGKLVCIGNKFSTSNPLLSKIKRFFFFRKYVKQQNFDVLIDFRYRLNPFVELLYSSLLYNSKTIYTIHSSKLSTYLPNSSMITRFITKNSRIVCVSNEIKELLQKKHNLFATTIYNPIDFTSIQQKSLESIDFDFQYILAIGRNDVTNVKQFDALIASYSKSNLPIKGIKLVLLGVGKNNENLKQIAITSQVENEIILLDFDSNAYKYLTRAMFLVLSSKYEGFPMAIIEALACQTPVISFDCVSGPKEIISHQENGLLVENQNFEELTHAMNLFVEDSIVYNHCKQNSLPSVSRFSEEKIGQQWLEFLQFDLHS